jgi:ubiquinone/menaquinone biosynthesis C-methylase UbiE
MAPLIAGASPETRDGLRSRDSLAECSNLRFRSGVIGHVKIALMTEAGRDSAARFSDRAADYVKYRPHYSPEVVHALQQACGLRPKHLIADVGCGPGLLAEIFLDNGNRVIGVEPNREMRRAADDYLAAYPKFSMVDGSAETTTLPDASLDFVVAGQAFHWFQPSETRTEFARILKPDGWAVLVWHDRNVHATPFLRAYEDFVRRHSIDYAQVAHKYVASYAALERFFAPNPMQLIQRHNQQRLDFDGLRGRLLSSSYIPKSGEKYEALSRELPQLFSSHAADGQVVLQYDTKIYFGHLDR